MNMKKLFLLPIFLLIISGCSADYSSTSQIPQSYSDNSLIVATTTKDNGDSVNSNTWQSPKVQTKNQNPASSDSLSNDNYYTNTAGNKVHSPAYEEVQNVVPAGASAQCGDGTYSFSQSRRGTCSHHGGVSTWY